MSKKIIACENDRVRKGMVVSKDSKIVLTRAVAELSESDRNILIEMIRAQDVFTADNDIHGEHDFGQVVVKGIRYFWKFDYYDDSLSVWQDPVHGCIRVLTIMAASDY